ncbi:MAG: hypothetical protein AB8U25_02790 [Rickettsiales endosymbiont of Dermacentor nuttalli]
MGRKVLVECLKESCDILSARQKIHQILENPDKQSQMVVIDKFIQEKLNEKMQETLTKQEAERREGEAELFDYQSFYGVKEKDVRYLLELLNIII